ncbi:TspO/MBR-like protein, partial [Cantharellus anzutake]|uniref:TspO/MBR-like protein n=1 Tax=Cantharellus anzutake TaxID=1750568 RepID=UPI001907AD28
LKLPLGLLSGYPTRRVVKSRWYDRLKAPWGRLPKQVFPIIWPILYMSMGYASHLAAITLNDDQSKRCDCLKLYYAQLALNLAWTPLFFVYKKKGCALLDLFALLGTTCKLTAELARITNGKSTWFLAPYCAWLTYATYLNAGYWWLNRGTR